MVKQAGIAKVTKVIRRCCSEKAPQLQRLFGDDFLQVPGFPAQILDLVRDRCPRRIAGKTPLAGFQKLLRPKIIEALGDAFARGWRYDRVSISTSRASSTASIGS
jgi:hypothetical protein